MVDGLYSEHAVGGERDYKSDRQKRMRKKLGKTLRTRLKREVKVMIKKRNGRLTQYNI